MVILLLRGMPSYELQEFSSTLIIFDSTEIHTILLLKNTF